MRYSQIAPVHGQTPLKRVVKGTLAGQMALALYRQRHAPRRLARARLAASREGRPVAAGSPARVACRAVVLIPAGPGAWPALRDTIESVLAFEGPDAKVVVLDDVTADCRAAVVRARFPAVDVIRSRWPAGGPTRLYPMLARGIRVALGRYDFEVLLKLDTDALVTGPGLTESARETFARHPRVGALGTCGVRADGVAEDYSYDAWMLAHASRWSRRVRRLAAQARNGGYRGAKVHGGVYLVSRPALDAALARGLLQWRPPWWAMLGEDTCMSLVVCAAGFELGSFGAPGEPTVSGNTCLPIDKEAVVRESKRAVHSVRRGRRGESEDELRAFFRALREGAPS
jgi:hypothetical protein